MEYKRSLYNTLTLGGYAVSAASKESIVPGVFEFSFDIRTIPEENVAEFARRFKSVVEKLTSNVEVKVTSVANSIVAKESKIAYIVRRCARKILGYSPRETISSGRLDISYYMVSNIDAIAYGPGECSQPHRVDEYIKLSSIFKAVRVYEAVIRELFNYNVT